MHRFQVVLAFVSFLCYCTAFDYFTTMPSSLKLLKNDISSEIDANQRRFFFFAGCFIWLFWMGVIWGFGAAEIRLRRVRHRFLGRLGLMLMMAPGLTLFPALAVEWGSYFVTGGGMYCLIYMSISVFLVQLMFLETDDAGLIDTLEATDLPLLPHANFWKVLWVSCLYYLRQIVLFAAEEIVIWWQPARILTRIRLKANTDVKLHNLNQTLVRLVDQSKKFVNSCEDVKEYLQAAVGEGFVAEGIAATFDEDLRQLDDISKAAEVFHNQ